MSTEEEWEKACKGPANARFPYGNTFDAQACNTEDETGEARALAASSQFAKCRSGYGVADLSGNVAEWTASLYGGSQDKAIKGGSIARPDYAARCSARKRNGPPSSRSAELGLRCCSELRWGGAWRAYEQARSSGRRARGALCAGRPADLVVVKSAELSA